MNWRPVPEHPLALTLSLLIKAEALHTAGVPDFEGSVHNVIARFLEERGFTDEKKADLYALLVEKLTPDMSHGNMRRACSACLHVNDTYWSTR